MSRKPVTRISDSLDAPPANGHHVEQESGKLLVTGDQPVRPALRCPLQQELNYPNFKNLPNREKIFFWGGG